MLRRLSGGGEPATNAPFTVDDGATAISTVMVNEQMIPTDATGNGMAWQSIGVYQAGSGDLNVTLGDAANGYVIANAVCLAAVPATTAAPSVVCTGDPTYSESPDPLSLHSTPLRQRRTENGGVPTLEHSRQ